MPLFRRQNSAQNFYRSAFPSTIGTYITNNFPITNFETDVIQCSYLIIFTRKQSFNSIMKSRFSFYYFIFLRNMFYFNHGNLPPCFYVLSCNITSHPLSFDVRFVLFSSFNIIIHSKQVLHIFCITTKRYTSSDPSESAYLSHYAFVLDCLVQLRVRRYMIV